MFGKDSKRRSKKQQCKKTLFIASDMHYLSPALTDRGASFRKAVDNADGKVMDFIEEILDAFTEEVIRARPDALILTGDLSFNGEAQSHRDFAKKLRRIEGAGVPVLVIPGNHDLESRNAVRFTGKMCQRAEGMDAAAFRALYGDFGYWKALSMAEDSFSYLYPIRKDLRVLCLDANADAAIPGRISRKTLAWAESALEEARRDGAEVLSVSHQNLYVHNRLFPYGFSLCGAGDLAALLKKQPVLCHLSGHMHLQHISRGGDAEGLVEICTSALATYPNQYGILEYDGAEAHYHTKEVDVGTGQKADRGDPGLPAFSAENIEAFLERLGTEEADALALSRFPAFSKAYFERGARQQAAKAMEELLEDGAGLGEELRQEMLEAFVRLHTAYFSGMSYPLEGISGGIAGWLGGSANPAPASASAFSRGSSPAMPPDPAPGADPAGGRGFMRRYLCSILEDPDRLWLPDHREIRIAPRH